jgi:phage host-nuclease inhibitor protein Gam
MPAIGAEERKVVVAQKVKQAAIAIKVPQSREETVRFIHQIGERQRMRTVLEAEMNDKIAAIKKEYEGLAKQHADRIVALTEGVKIWCAAHRAELTKDGKVKSAQLATGEVRWRMTPPSVTLRNVKGALAALLTAGLDRFIREKLEIDKEAILKEPEAVADIAGITISQHEEFVIIPFETKLEQVA